MAACQIALLITAFIYELRMTKSMSREASRMTLKLRRIPKHKNKCLDIYIYTSIALQPPGAKNVDEN